jgi:hypothetical protein
MKKLIEGIVDFRKNFLEDYRDVYHYDQESEEFILIDEEEARSMFIR